jgi:tRNA U34 5-methylaminomethyl-2-thiouridine-forming methyltransferase MnmC
MELELLTTADGSHTLVVRESNVTYHSKHGAIQESVHVYINAGLHYAMQEKMHLKIFEMGFGTGLNALLTYQETKLHNLTIEYHTVETNPIDNQLASLLNYPEQLGSIELTEPFEAMHQAAFGECLELSPAFSFTKFGNCITAFNPLTKYHVIYYDAFAPAAHPELWTFEIFEKLKGMLEPGGCLVTYCSKGDVRRAMHAAGLTVHKIQGPWGKREMIRALNQPVLSQDGDQ